ncbi:MAG: hypothetical protein QME58_03915 [Bacteroidota bacterium]|nr:hypothetical protein [Bacteroidota bacterium]
MLTQEKKPKFIKDNTFKLLIPINEKMMAKMVGGGVSGGVVEGISDGINDGVSDGVSDGVKNGLISVVTIITKNPGIRVEGIVPLVKKAKPTIERYIKILREINLIEYQGAPKTGGYYLTENMKKKLKQ